MSEEDKYVELPVRDMAAATNRPNAQLQLHWKRVVTTSVG
jgi:hypothetical protein